MSQVNQVSERTPLLGPASSTTPNADVEHAPTNSSASNSDIPSIRSLERSLAERPADAPLASTINLIVRSSVPDSDTTRAALVLLLCFRKIVASQSTNESTMNVGQSISRSSLMEVGQFVQEEWHALVDHATQDEVDEAMWMQVRLDEVDDSPCIRVVDFFFDDTIPLPISMHRKALTSIMNRWSRRRPDSGGMHNILDVLEYRVTPRVLHSLELAVLIAHVALLVFYTLDPPALWPRVYSFDWRTTTLQISSIAFIAQRPTSAISIPFFLTFLAITTSLPSLPHPSELSFATLLFCLGLHALQLHLPLPPSPIFLMPQSKAFLLSSILSTTVRHVIVPACLFFLPLLLISFMLLSYSVYDPSFVIMQVAAPIEARVAFLSIVFFAIILIASLAFTLLSILSSTQLAPATDFIALDVYGAYFGLRARQAMQAATIQYSTPRFFPVPFNLFQLLFVALPCGFMRMIGRKDGLLRMKEVVERVLWRCSVLPLAMVFAGLWGWSLTERF